MKRISSRSISRKPTTNNGNTTTNPQSSSTQSSPHHSRRSSNNSSPQHSRRSSATSPGPSKNQTNGKKSSSSTKLDYKQLKNARKAEEDRLVKEAVAAAVAAVQTHEKKLEKDAVAAQAAAAAAAEVQLPYKGLHDIPPLIFEAIYKKSLRVLNLSYNKLKALPDTLPTLSVLSYLSLHKNQLDSLPDSLGSVITLTYLDVSSNHLDKLPDSIFKLPALTSLNISSNAFTSLPDSLGSLTPLKQLMASSNKLEALPETLGKLTNLNVLGCSHNHLRTLPDSIGNLAQLKSLELNENRLNSLPLCLARLSNLQTVHAFHNPFEDYPVFQTRRYQANLRDSLALLAEVDVYKQQADYLGLDQWTLNHILAFIAQFYARPLYDAYTKTRGTEQEITIRDFLSLDSKSLSGYRSFEEQDRKKLLVGVHCLATLSAREQAGTIPVSSWKADHILAWLAPYEFAIPLYEHYQKTKGMSGLEVTIQQLLNLDDKSLQTMLSSEKDRSRLLLEIAQLAQSPDQIYLQQQGGTITIISNNSDSKDEKSSDPPTPDTIASPRSVTSHFSANETPDIPTPDNKDDDQKLGQLSKLSVLLTEREQLSQQITEYEEKQKTYDTKTKEMEAKITAQKQEYDVKFALLEATYAEERAAWESRLKALEKK